MKRPCLDCGRLIDKGSRCPQCESIHKAQKRAIYGNAAWRDDRQQAITAEPYCHRCGKTGVRLVMGHWVSWRKGGRTARPLCYSCNAIEG